MSRNQGKQKSVIFYQSSIVEIKVMYRKLCLK